MDALGQVGGAGWAVGGWLHRPLSLKSCNLLLKTNFAEVPYFQAVQLMSIFFYEPRPPPSLPLITRLLPSITAICIIIGESKANAQLPLSRVADTNNSKPDLAIEKLTTCVCPMWAESRMEWGGGPLI